MKNNSTAPAWMDKLADGVDSALASSGIDKDDAGAAIFIAVHPNPDGSKHVVHEIRGGNGALAEAIGALVYNRDFPAILHLGAAAALQMRHLENRAANKNHKPHNKKRK